MRRAKSILTKGHLLMYTITTEKNDDIWSREVLHIQNNVTKTINAIMVYTSGNVRSFTSDGSTWRNHADTIAPLMSIWPAGRVVGKTSGGWALVNNANTIGTVSGILAREDYNTGHWGEMAAANAQEISTIDSNPEQTIIVKNQCTTTRKRDLSTFDKIDSTQDIELEIDWGSYSNT